MSVITTKRAYDELELEGFIDSVQGRGSFVASKNTELLKEEQRKKVEDYLNLLSPQLGLLAWLFLI